MGNLAIIALDPKNGGGVLHSMLAYKKILEQHFKTVELLFLSFDPGVATSVRRFKLSSGISKGLMLDTKFVAIGAKWAFYEPWHYSAVIDLWAKELANFDSFFVTSGTAIAAHSLALLNKKYTLSFASDFKGDRQAATEPNLFRKYISSLAQNSMNKIEQQCLSKAHALLPMSSYAKNKAQEILGHQNQKKQIVVPYPIFQHSSEVKPQTKDPNLCVSIARFKDPRKNTLMLLQAWTLVVKSCPKAKLVLIGEPPEEGLLQTYKQLFSSGYLELMPNLNSQQKFDLLSKSSVLLISSDQEGLGITGLEAGLCKTAVVSTMCGGPKDYIIHGQTGLFSPIGCAQLFAQNIILLLSNPQLSKNLGESLHTLLQEKFSTKQIAQNLLSSFC